MKLTFYPREIELFQDGEYDFNARGRITLACTTKEHYRQFQDRQELIDYLSEKGVPMTDHIYPLRIDKERHNLFGIEMTHSVSQKGTVFGWIKEFTT